jgi:Mg2+ and Co2+ transporter CorA
VSDGDAQRCAPERLPDLLARDDGFVWVDLPVDDPETERVLADVFGFHPLAVRDCLERNPVAKVHVYADHDVMTSTATRCRCAGGTPWTSRR